LSKALFFTENEQGATVGLRTLFFRTLTVRWPHYIWRK